MLHALATCFLASFACSTLAVGHCTSILHILAAGLLNELCQASTYLRVAVNQSKGSSRRCYAVCAFLLDAWHIIAVIWPGKLLLGNIIALSVLPISQLAATVLDSFCDSSSMSTSPDSTSSGSSTQKASESNSRRSRHFTLVHSSELNLLQQMQDWFQHDPEGTYYDSAKCHAGLIAVLVGGKYTAEVSEEVSDRMLPSICQLESSADFQRLLMVAFAAWVSGLHAQQQGLSPTVQVVTSSTQQQQQQQQLVVPPHHAQLLLVCGETATDSDQWVAGKLSGIQQSVHAGAHAIARVWKPHGCTPADSSSSSTPTQQQQHEASSTRDKDAEVALTLVQTLLEAALLSPTKRQLGILVSLCNCFNTILGQQQFQVFGDLLQPAIELLLPVLIFGGNGEVGNLQDDGDGDDVRKVLTVAGALLSFLFRGGMYMREFHSFLLCS